MRKEKVILPDGRYVIYYSFEDEKPAEQTDSEQVSEDADSDRERE